jgi:DNA repair ATPase RecN
MGTKTQLRTLYEYRQRLLQISDCSSATLQMRDERLNSVESEITQLEAFAQGLQNAVETLNTLQAVRQWQQQFLRQVERFQDTPFHENLEVANERVRHIQELFDDLEAISRKLPSNFQEAAPTVKKLDQILNQADPWFSPTQKQLITQTRQGIDQYVQQKMAEAHQGYLTLEADIGKGNFSQVAEKLKSPPPFFPQNDKPKLITLSKRVQQRMDEDVVVWIETQFRQITDLAIRQQCLDRLKKILEE